MPILEYHLAEDRYGDEQLERLLVRSSHLYAEILESPVERVRVYAHFFKPAHMAVGGRRVAAGAPDAPHFRFLVLEGRPLEQCHRLLEGFTDLVVEILLADRALVRGACWPVPPQHWSIAGTPASVARAAEVAARVQDLRQA
ncbi:tautomerase family protein [Azohydromonas lata]|uniref:Tautomerase family protein n=1 Tax=Azohydromonas lata TaxID=45677 RepID=A0ABU5IMI0_9BURK|nr:tautomerase family protein [Azohydromonas lata]MDZ5460104.1 tautomerase family protein [Azohydromonas lata]